MSLLALSADLTILQKSDILHFTNILTSSELPCFYSARAPELFLFSGTFGMSQQYSKAVLSGRRAFQARNNTCTVANRADRARAASVLFICKK